MLPDTWVLNKKFSRDLTGPGTGIHSQPNVGQLRALGYGQNFLADRFPRLQVPIEHVFEFLHFGPKELVEPEQDIPGKLCEW